MLRDVRMLIEQRHLDGRIHLGLEVRGLQARTAGGEGWRVESVSSSRVNSTECTWAIVCTNRRLGTPRQLQAPGEAEFSGEVRRGIGGDIADLSWKGRS